VAKTAKPFNGDVALSNARCSHLAAANLRPIGFGAMLPIGIGPMKLSTVVYTDADRAWAPYHAGPVLEALALELILKVWLHRAGTLETFMRSPGRDKHNHLKMLQALRRAIGDAPLVAAEKRYQYLRTKFDTPPGMEPIAPTLEGALGRSGDIFVEWRYSHERTDSIISYNFEMWCAFEALNEGL
jgi:hypothetical protein